MSKNTYINPAQVTVIYSWEMKFQKDFQWTEIPEKKTLFGLVTVQEAKRGYKSMSSTWACFGDFWLHTEKDWSEYNFVEQVDGLHSLAEISIGLSDGNGVRKSFRSNQEMYDYLESSFKGVKLIKM